MKLNNYYKLIGTTVLCFLGLLNLSAQTCLGPLSIGMPGSGTADSLQVMVNAEDITCASDVNGSITLLVNGGSPDYEFQWSDVTNVDSVRYNLDEGIYFVTITDRLGCTQELNWNITELNPDNTDLIMTDGCGTCWLNNGGSTYFFDANTKYIAAATDIASDMTDLEDTEVCVYIDNTINTCNNHPYLQRHWSVDPNNADNACIKLFYTQQEFENLAAAVPNETVTFQDLVDHDRMCITAWSGGGESCGDFETEVIYSMAASPPLVVTYEDPTEGIWSIEVCTDQFATFYVHVCGLNLPVELIHFTGKKDGNTNLLRWETASELNSSHFELEKSIDGWTFNYLDRVEAAGNSSEVNAYAYRDYQPSESRDYYRLKIVDLDGTFEYSNIIVIKHGESSLSRLFPTLFNDYVYYETTLYANDYLSFVVYDAIGQVAHTQNFQIETGTHQLPLRLDRLPSGTYYVQVRSQKNGLMEGYKIIRQ